jgi:hypothetical protein
MGYSSDLSSRRLNYKVSARTTFIRYTLLSCHSLCRIAVFPAKKERNKELKNRREKLKNKNC